MLSLSHSITPRHTQIIASIIDSIGVISETNDTDDNLPLLSIGIIMIICCILKAWRSSTTRSHTSDHELQLITTENWIKADYRKE